MLGHISLVRYITEVVDLMHMITLSNMNSRQTTCRASYKQRSHAPRFKKRFAKSRNSGLIAGDHLPSSPDNVNALSLRLTVTDLGEGLGGL